MKYIAIWFVISSLIGSLICEIYETNMYTVTRNFLFWVLG